MSVAETRRSSIFCCAVICIVLLIIVAGLFPFPFQILDIDPEDQAEEDGGHTDLDSQRKGKCVVIKTSTRQVRQPSLHLSVGFTTVVQGKIMPPLFSLFR